ncbi:MAG: hypothetical protein RXR74_00805 [Nitrososphaeria archaeon]
MFWISWRFSLSLSSCFARTLWRVSASSFFSMSSAFSFSLSALTNIMPACL